MGLTLRGSADPWPVASPGPVDGVTVWRVGTRLDRPTREAALALLCEDERARVERFLRPEDRDRSAAGRAALRLILAGALNLDPRAVVLWLGPAGKPELIAGDRRAVAFNVSHSGDWALVAVSPGARIGVDVEAMRPLPDPLGLARPHFAAAETEALARLPPEAHLPAFYACWTRKEAVVKALGAGLGHGLARFTVAVPPQPAALLDLDGSPAEAGGWTLADLPLGPGYAAALAIEAAGVVPVLRSLVADRVRAPS